MKTSTDQSKKIYYSIGQVADMFQVNTSLIRFWEKEFSVLRPRKNKKGNRLFTARDIRYLHMIYHLVKNKGYTLQGAKEVIKTDFDKIEEKVVLLGTLKKLRNFLSDLDQSLAEKQRS
ncbi:MAG: MerR family transcriptional regulator [Bacteroidetes bacterium]|jgi:DNA-binding transcriptional MerR regulator|nr:MerR family transcriptional regulator [Bacteroidota bacterium]